MRAKRSKKYRKIISTYNLQFSFRTPYQILCDSNFLRTCHSFKMPIAKYLSNTLHGEAKPYLTQCTLAAVMEQHKKKVSKGQTQEQGRGDGKPDWLPLPLEVPLRYCKHKDAEGKTIGPLGEAACLLDFLSGHVKGNQIPKNKDHYILATAESEEEQQGKRRKKGINLREEARTIPGVPIVYVKRSVMILEEPSAASERYIRGLEKDKFRQGLIMNDRSLKRKRDDEDEEGDPGADSQDNNAREGGPKIRGMRKAKGPNPLSVMKKKVKTTPQNTSGGQNGSAKEPTKKKKNRRLRGKKQKTGDGDEQGSSAVVVSNDDAAAAA